ncbi:Hypothetical protein D9617_2g058280 [Elsinoe fawcettii]|nr:Hypothetical protein D9617_2g058280 [Elsinoe fawcettii]
MAPSPSAHNPLFMTPGPRILSVPDTSTMSFVKEESVPPHERTSKDYGFCFAGAGYLHNIPEENQLNTWLPCPRFRNQELDTDAVPFSAHDTRPDHTDPDTENFLWVGMAIEPRLGLCAQETTKMAHVNDGHIRDLARRTLVTERDRAFPVITRTTDVLDWRVITYALVSLDNDEDEYACEAWKVRPEEVFFFYPYRDPGDSIKNPRDRRRVWNNIIRASVKREIGADSTDEDGEPDSEEDTDSEDVMVTCNEHDSEDWESSHIQHANRGAQRQLTGDMSHHDSNTWDGLENSNKSEQLNHQHRMDLASSVELRRSQRRMISHDITHDSTPISSIENSVGHTSASPSTAEVPIFKLDVQRRHEISPASAADALKEALRDNIGFLRKEIRKIRAGGDSSHDVPRTHTAWLERFEVDVEDMAVQSRAISDGTLVEFVRDFEAVFRKQVKRGRQQLVQHSGKNNAVVLFMDKVEEEIKDMGFSRQDSGLQ